MENGDTQQYLYILLSTEVEHEGAITSNVYQLGIWKAM